MNLVGIPYPWPRDRNSAGTGAGQPKSPHGRPVSITSLWTRAHQQCSLTHGSHAATVWQRISGCAP